MKIYIGIWKLVLLTVAILAAGILFMTIDGIAIAANPVGAVDAEPVSLGPFVPTVYNGSLLDLPVVQGETEPGEILSTFLGRTRMPPDSSPSFVDPVLQSHAGSGQMPEPIMNFPGVTKAQAGGWIPPDTNGEIGPDHYIQTVNVGIGIFDRFTGAPLYIATYNTFFSPAPSPCNTQNRGDVIVLYDHLADRWVVTDFSLPSGGPYYECIAVSQSGDPIGGGWFYYAFEAKPAGQYWHDYPKLGVWPDAYYMTANIFNGTFQGAQVWALDRVALLNGDPLMGITFGPYPAYGSLLPSNLEGAEPPTGSPNYFASISYPDQLQIWEFHVDWANPGNSSFTGPIELTVANYGFISEIPQPAPGAMLDSLGDRLMMQLQYRNFGDYESLWVNHTVSNAGIAGIRWYEVRDPGNSPILYQQGTYQPDAEHRWMGSLAVDGDGNMALGYSLTSETVMPAIRYSGRLNGETPGELNQGEAELIQGTGVQTGSNRWGDYSDMSIDPLDDCTFWYTQEFYQVNGSNWVTQIGSFRFPSCGQPKGFIAGTIYDAVTLSPISGVTVIAEGITTTFTTQSDISGMYTMTLPSATFTVTAGPVLPGYPIPAVINDVTVVAGEVYDLDIPLSPSPAFVSDASIVDDSVPGGNGNGFLEPGESEINLYISANNIGAAGATNVIGTLEALSTGVDILVAQASYPDIGPGGSEFNDTPYVISISPDIICGTTLEFMVTLDTDQGQFTITTSLVAAILQPRESYFMDDMENGSDNWTTGGVNNTWALTTASYHSPTNSFTDSPAGNYSDNTDSWLRSPIFDLSGISGIELNLWQSYSTEEGWDFIYVEYSVDGGANWAELSSNTGSQLPWTITNLPLPDFNDQSEAVFRFRLNSDAYVTDIGWYIDDVDLTHIPYECTYTAVQSVYLPFVSK